MPTEHSMRPPLPGSNQRTSEEELRLVRLLLRLQVLHFRPLLPPEHDVDGEWFPLQSRRRSGNTWESRRRGNNRSATLQPAVNRIPSLHRVSAAHLVSHPSSHFFPWARQEDTTCSGTKEGVPKRGRLEVAGGSRVSSLAESMPL